MIRTALPHTLCLSPNVDPRPPGVQPSILLLHYTGMETAEAALRWLCTPHAKVSCHYLVDEAGGIVQMVGEEMRAWHAGVSCWAGEHDVNARSIGIEIHNPGHTLGYPDFPDVQIAAVVVLAQDIVRRHAILPEGVLAHSDVAPRRKIDPGEKFDWERLHAAGVGLWSMAAAPDGSPGSLDSQEVRQLQRQLRIFGYDIAETDCYDHQTEVVVKAFQRHYRPQRVDGIADASTRGVLKSLLQQLGRC